MESFAYADQILAYHDKNLMNRIREYLVDLVKKPETTELTKQYVWRTLVIGWYKLACNTEQQLELLKLFVDHSK